MAFISMSAFDVDSRAPTHKAQFRAQKDNHRYGTAQEQRRKKQTKGQFINHERET